MKRTASGATPRRVWLIGLILVASMTLAHAAPPDPPVFRGASGQFTLLTPIDLAPNTPIRALDGRVADLSQFRGRVVVLNFWATWCLPCAAELPSLDRLAAKSNSRDIAVIAVSIDENGAAAVVPFIADHHLQHVAVYLDPRQRLGSPDMNRADVLPLWGLPITYILDRKGGVRGYLTGPANWDSPAAGRLLDYFAGAATR